MADAVRCDGCGGAGQFKQRGFPVAICGACHGRGIRPKTPRWLAWIEMQEAIDAPLGA